MAGFCFASACVKQHSAELQSTFNGTVSLAHSRNETGACKQVCNSGWGNKGLEKQRSRCNKHCYLLPRSPCRQTRRVTSSPGKSDRRSIVQAYCEESSSRGGATASRGGEGERDKKETGHE